MLSDSILQLVNPFSALFAGFVTSLHCMGMCGPLACALFPKHQNQGSQPLLNFGGYHLGKLVSYALLGALAGAIGSRFIESTAQAPSQILTWSMAVFFLLIAMGLDRFAKGLPGVGKFSRTLSRKAYQVKGSTRGLALGLGTPLIPCGPLYVIVWVAALAGGAVQGATILAMFGLGTIPSLLATQLGWNFLTLRVGPERLSIWRRNAALVACLILVMRSLVDLSYESIVLGKILCH